jgi:hypothetical protein
MQSVSKQPLLSPLVTRVERVGSQGETSLHCAVQSGVIEAIELILRKTTKLNQRTKGGKTALQLAQESHPAAVPLIETVLAEQVPWREVKAEGKWPVPRCNHSSSVYNSRWYIYGGENDFSSGGRVNNDLHFFNSSTSEWRILAPQGDIKPPPLSKHSSLIYGTSLYLFGGTDGEKVFNDIWVLDLGT